VEEMEYNTLVEVLEALAQDFVDSNVPSHIRFTDGKRFWTYQELFKQATIPEPCELYPFPILPTGVETFWFRYSDGEYSIIRERKKTKQQKAILQSIWVTPDDE
jgi:hypothetical protein